jgi:hypothetical protein
MPPAWRMAHGPRHSLNILELLLPIGRKVIISCAVSDQACLQLLLLLSLQGAKCCAKGRSDWLRRGRAK